MANDVYPPSLLRRISAIEADLRRLNAAASTGGGGFDPNADPVVIGSGANGNGTPSGIIVGVNAVAENGSGGGAGFEQVTIGPNAYTGSDDAIAIGAGVASTATWAVGIGYYVSADGQSSIGIGRNAQAETDHSIAIGPNTLAIGGTSDVCIGDGATIHTAGSAIAIGKSASVEGARTVAIGENAGGGGVCVDGTAVGGNAVVDNGATGAAAYGAYAGARADYATAVGYQADTGGSTHVQSTALGANALCTKPHQIMLGTSAEFVEIPGDSSTAPNGLVLTDTATSTRYLVQITSGALVLSTAP